MVDKFTPGSGYFNTPMSSFGSYRSYKTAPSSMNTGSAYYASGPPRSSYLTSMAEDDMDPDAEETSSSPNHPRGRPVPGEKSKLDFPKRKKVLQLSYLENVRILPPLLFNGFRVWENSGTLSQAD
jgi:hypothetical protein